MSRDDDLDEPLSNRRALERADHGKKEKEELRQQVEQKKEMRNNLAVLKQGMQAHSKDEERKQDDGEGGGTLTREQEVKRNIDTVKTKPGAEKMLQKQQAAEEAKKQQGALEQGKDKTA